jgi:hypothetical protein
MSFLAPAFFLALAALAVPILLHLIQREQRRIVEFPSLMFLRKIPYQSVRRRRLRHLALLAMRLAALLLIVLAFARPFLRQSSVDAVAAAGPREVVILLDWSYSMGYGDRWARARAAAQAHIDALGPADRGTLVFFATEPVAEVRSSPDASRLRAALDAAAPGAGATRFGPALRLAQSILAASTLARRELVLVSDFQRTGWSRDAAVRLPAGVVVTPVNVGGEETANLSVTSITLQRTSFSDQDRVVVTAAIANRGGAPVRGQTVALEIDGRGVASGQTDVAANASASVSFPPFTLTNANTRGTVRLPNDALAADNTFHFVLSPSRPIPVLLVERRSGDPASLYLRRALDIGTAPRFAVQRTTPDRLLAATLPAGAVAVLNDVVPPAAERRHLTTAVENGAGVLAILGEGAAWPEAGSLLPGLPGAIVDREVSRAAVLAATDSSHPAFEPFRAARSGDFASASFFRYRAFTPGDSARTLARFDDGAVALAEHRVGRGRVAVWTSTMDTYWNDLALRPVFLPFVHRLVAHLGQYVEPAAWMTVGQVVDPTTIPGVGPAPTEGSRAIVALTPFGEQVRQNTGEPGAVELTVQGFYELRDPERGWSAALAVNRDVAESDLASLDPGEVTAALAGGAAAETAADAPPLTPAEQERRLDLWWYLLLAALALLAAETIVSNRLSRA